MRFIATAFATGMLALFVMLAGPTSQVEAASKNSENDTKSTVVTVKQGDFLSKIADKHDTTYQRLFNANPKISHPDVIYPGQKIRVPADNEKLSERAIPGVAAASTEQLAQAPVNAAAPAPTPVARTQATTTKAQPSGGVWDQLAQCESGGNWSINTGNGYYGGLQFSQSSWQAVGGTGSPANASKSEQIARAEKLQAIQGWGAWPACSAKLGLR